MAGNLLQFCFFGNMNTAAPPTTARPGGALLLLILLLGGLTLGELRADKAKPGASSLMMTQDKAELERQMVETEQRLTNAVATLEKKQAAQSSVSEGMWWLGAVFLVVGAIAFVKLMPQFNFFLDMRTKARMAAANASAEATATLAAEEESVSEFAARFRVGPKPAEPLPSATPAIVSVSTLSPAVEEKSEPAADLVKEFLATAPKRLAKFSELAGMAEKAAEEGAKVTVMTEFSRELELLKDGAEFPALLPAWQLAAALGGLVKQLVDKPKNITPSTMRTINGALDVLRMVCAPGLPADLLADPPIRLLAVDDDPLSRHAIAFALKKALSQPDIAANGQAALALATQIGYDAVFVDVQMPGMDGFELCGKIHETLSNATTPVVFVTCQNDDEAREKAMKAGGQDLVAKPFLIFEITVKAVTLVMRRRLEKKQPGQVKPEKEPVLAAA
jgi:CheY-like chemotaxis protein